mmetsp:Transcript_34376/g.42340  ORF Transcript_34376/g.42340 Transcript_34376/m.42340 type:complete len:328 (-) Transcript_34376:223-1206(-)
MIFGVGEMLMKMVKAQIHLWFAPRFQVHRVTGLVFLLQFFAAFYLYIFNYERYLESPLVWTLGMTGLIQAITAACTFRFMPNVADPGFIAMADKAPLSYKFIVENSFFAMLLAFQYCYMDNKIFEMIRAVPPIEILFVFLPYYIRPLWPITRIRTALENSKNKSDKNRWFYHASTYIVKVFYCFAKHYIGFFLNYIRFLGRITKEDQKTIHGILITSSYMTTIALFLHTLKFKGWLGPKTATVAYEGAYFITAWFYWKFLGTIAANLDLALLCFVGLVLNFAPRGVWHAYQAFVLAYLWYARANAESMPVSTLPPVLSLPSMIVGEA